MSTKQVKDWITVNHQHIPIYEGESKQDAINRSAVLQNEKKKESEIQQNQKDAKKLNQNDTPKPVHRSTMFVTIRNVELVFGLTSKVNKI